MVRVFRHNEWMQLTEGLTSIRSKELKAVDSSLEIYNKERTPANLESLHESLKTWTRGRTNWRSSVRNKRGAVDDLYRQVRNELGVVQHRDWTDGARLL